MSVMAVSRPIDVQRRLVELGRIRLGEKGEKGEPRRLTHFRLTSASSRHLEAVAAIYGGQVRPWRGAPDEGYFELATTSAELDILIPPTLAAYSQAYELWQGGTCERRCDGVTEQVSGGPCLCDPNARTCQVTTRVSVMLPKVPGLGVWRLDTKGWNAATTLPATLELLGAMAQGAWVPAVLRMEQRSKRVRDPQTRQVQTRRFVVPVVDIVDTPIGQVVLGEAPPAPRLELGTNRREKVARPALPAGPEPPTAAAFSITSGAATTAPLREGSEGGEEPPPSPSTPAGGRADTAPTDSVIPMPAPPDEPPHPAEAVATCGAAMNRGGEVCWKSRGHGGSHRSKDGAWPA